MGMKTVCLHLTMQQIELLDQLVKKGHYANRSEAVRIAIRDLLIAERMWRP